MGGMEFNKIFAAILVAGIIASFSGFVAKKLVHPHELEEDAYPVEGVEVVSGPAQVEQKAEPILHLIAQAESERGQKVAKACAACHSFDKGGAHGVGPNLWDIVRAEKQAKDGYAYSGVLDANGEEYWTYIALNKYLWKPKKYAPGTKMNYIGLKKPEDRAALIAWLRTQAPSPASLPSEAEIEAEKAELSPPEPEEGNGDEKEASEDGEEAEQTNQE